MGSLFYTGSGFMNVRGVVFLVMIGIAAVARAVEKPLDAGRIVDVQHKVNTRILYYLVNTPVTQDDPYYEVAVQIGNTVYRGVHTPTHRGDTLPDEWKPAADVQVKVEGRSFSVRRPDGSQMDFTIVKRFVKKTGSADATVEGKK